MYDIITKYNDHAKFLITSLKTSTNGLYDEVYFNITISLPLINKERFV